MEQLKLLVSSGLGLSLIVMQPALALPPPEDLPEEILRTEIILEARSPIDGEPLSAAEYAQLQAELEAGLIEAQAPAEIQHLIFQLNLLKFLRTFLPFF